MVVEKILSIMHFYSQGVGNWNKWRQRIRWVNFNVDIFQSTSSTVSTTLTRASTRVRLPPLDLQIWCNKHNVWSTQKLHYYKTTLSFKLSTWSSFSQARVERIRHKLRKGSYENRQAQQRTNPYHHPTMALVLKHNMPAIKLKLRMKESSRYRYPYIIRWGESLFVFVGVNLSVHSNQCHTYARNPSKVICTNNSL